MIEILWKIIIKYKLLYYVRKQIYIQISLYHRDRYDNVTLSPLVQREAE